MAGIAATVEAEPILRESTVGRRRVAGIAEVPAETLAADAVHLLAAAGGMLAVAAVAEDRKVVAVTRAAADEEPAATGVAKG
jgi:hypothetical protein